MQNLIILLSRLNVTRVLTGTEAERLEATSQMAGALAASVLILGEENFLKLINEIELDETTVEDLLSRVTNISAPAQEL